MNGIAWLQKHRYFVVSALALVTALLFFIKDFRGTSIDFLLNQKPMIRTILTCKPQRIADDVLVQRLGSADPIRLLIHFTEQPTMDVRDYLSSERVTIYTDSWVYDYLVAQTTVDRLCFLDQLPGITGISAGQ